MNETITTILLVVVTNWISLGELKTKDGKTFDVLEGRLQTNTVAKVFWTEVEQGEMLVKNGVHPYIMEFKHTNEFILKSVQGPVVDTKRVEITNVWINQTWITNIPHTITNFTWPQNGVFQTNRTTW